MKKLCVILFIISNLGCENIGVENLDNSNFQTIVRGANKTHSYFTTAPLSSPALYFDGVDDYVVVPDDPSLDLTKKFTIAAWIYLDSYTEWASVVTKGGLPDNLGNSDNYTIHQSGPTGGANPDLGTEFGHLRFTPGFTINSIQSPESKSIFALGEWYFITVTFDGKTLKFYLNGELDGEHSLLGSLNPNDEPLNIGVDFPGGDEYWHGMIDDLRIWNKSLKQKHIQAAMLGGSPRASQLVGHWTFDEGSGNIAYDISKYHNHGTLVGNPTWVNP